GGGAADAPAGVRRSVAFGRPPRRGRGRAARHLPHHRPGEHRRGQNDPRRRAPAPGGGAVRRAPGAAPRRARPLRRGRGDRAAGVRGAAPAGRSGRVAGTARRGGNPAILPPVFFFCATNVGSERPLKAEIARLRPDARPAFARPGLVTFKAGAALAPDFALGATFARAWGLSLGEADVERAARAVGATRLHAWDREGGPPPATEELRGTGLFAPGDVAVVGETVLDVVLAAGEPPWLGWHVHDAAHPPWPGGLVPVEVPSEAPSRAYAKVEEAIAWWGAPLKRGETAVGLGDRPGGASYALL